MTFPFPSRSPKRIRLATCLAIGLMLPALALASATPYPSALSSRIVRFIANPNNTYVLYLHPGMVTDIELAQGESLKALALGDTVQWITQQVPGTNDVFIKPVKAGLQTSATLVTNQRTYQLMLVSRKKGDWYQEVHFEAQSPIVFAAPDAPDVPNEAAMNVPRPDHVRHHHHRGVQVPNTDRFSDLKLSELRFGWTMSGKASFRPLRVFSSPDFVWIQLPPHAPSPIVFARQGDTWGIVNFDHRGRWIVVQSRARAFELRADGHQIRLHAPAQHGGA